MILVVGSTALALYNVDIGRLPKDLDYWYTEDEEKSVIESFSFIEDFKYMLLQQPEVCYQESYSADGHKIDKNLMLRLIHRCRRPILLHNRWLYIATPDMVYNIKRSHFEWDVKWQKTKRDLLILSGFPYYCKVNDTIYPLLRQKHQDEHEDKKKFLSLSKSKEEFFDAYVKKMYDHDYLHELAAYPSPPVYTKCLEDGEQVLISKAKFDILTQDEKLKMFREEIAVIACERWLLPWLEKDGNSWSKWVEAYNLSLKKTITNLTKGWATEWIIDNLAHYVKPRFEEFEHILLTLKLESVIEMSKAKEKFESILKEKCPETWERYETKPKETLWELAMDYTFPLKADLDNASYKHVMQEGGNEGDGEHCEGVFELDGVLFYCTWSYYSHDGPDYHYILNTLCIVEPYEKTVIDYRVVEE